MPYPPNKGDKVRSYHLLQHLAQRHRVYLGTFVDDPDDWGHLPVLRSICADVCAVALRPRLARWLSLAGLASGEPLTLHYYRSRQLQHWIEATRARHAIDAAVVFSSSMAQFVAPDSGLPTLVDLVDVDSAKWSEYARSRPWPMSWLYRREGERLLDFERAVVARSSSAFLVTEKEVELFRGLAPDAGGKVQALCNGVDAEHFSPSVARVSPFSPGEIPLVFTGAMDYWPNVDAVSWFAREVLPALRQQWPALRFHIVGRNPDAGVRALGGPGVVISGTVPDVRPYLQHAAVVVAPLRLARGVQNKVLEAMAMGRPVVCATACIEAIAATPGIHLLAADGASAYASQIGRLLDDPAAAATIGSQARALVQTQFSWSARLGGLANILDAAIAAPPNLQTCPA